jgi:hypothetical protein
MVRIDPRVKGAASYPQPRLAAAIAGNRPRRTDGNQHWRRGWLIPISSKFGAGAFGANFTRILISE